MNSQSTNYREAVESIRKAAGPAARIAYVSGNFNIVHPGHLRLLKFAREQADFLVVGIYPDSNPGVSMPVDLRVDGVCALSSVDFVVRLDRDAVGFIEALQPDVVVKGSEYAQRHNDEETLVNKWNGKLVFGSGEMRFVSLGLLRREYFETNLSTIRKPTDYPARHGFAFAELSEVLRKFSALRVMVIGDLIVDEYIQCDPLGMSQEDPTIVITPIESTKFLGGAGIVAAHARGLGAFVQFVSVVGADADAGFARERLDSFAVQAELITDDTRPTTLKQRFRAHGKTLLRVNHLRQHAVSPSICAQIMDLVRQGIEGTDLLVLSDFNYGCLPQSLVDAICALARGRNVMVAADSQASSQFSDISRFKDMALITPTEREARLALHDFDSGLAYVAERLRNVSRAENVIVTLGAEGLFVRGVKEGEELADRLPAFNSAPKDVAGAGDSLFACSSLALCAGADIWRAAYLGSIASACQTTRVGNTPLTLADVEAEIFALE
ncbi:PfkB family carbohydrate kinase [Methylocystis bryophila]|uniref:ADP-heptose synthase n=1 Tax=Methylocystis bryophila TaxID=655015 RepID=A0A1W6N080_9HYPH|nr:PfkB family carbohydrate kinase [Methylocystis bryophila]ARN83213.1 ADP-heptose synthase [Methylocystis bryophila]